MITLYTHTKTFAGIISCIRAVFSSYPSFHSFPNLFSDLSSSRLSFFRLRIHTHTAAHILAHVHCIMYTVLRTRGEITVLRTHKKKKKNFEKNINSVKCQIYSGNLHSSYFFFHYYYYYYFILFVFFFLFFFFFTEFMYSSLQRSFL